MELKAETSRDLPNNFVCMDDCVDRKNDDKE